MRRLILGITGGIGSGKSTIMTILEEEYKAILIEADKIAHRITEPGYPAYDDIVDAFGKKILEKKTGIIDRKKLGEIVFKDEEKLKLLNSFIHPRVKEYINEQIQMINDDRKDYLICIEAALLIEDNYSEICDKLWYIYADTETRFKRVSKTRKMKREKFEEIINNQRSEEEFRNGCDLTIDNSKDIEFTKLQIKNALED